jgi:hypothetical protein
MGLLIAGCGNVNQTVMAGTTPSHLRTTIFGLDRVFEGIIGARAITSLSTDFNISALKDTYEYSCFPARLYEYRHVNGRLVLGQASSARVPPC